MAASNTRACFRESIGKTVVGVLFDAMPPHRRDLAAGTKTLVFSDGTGLTFASNGSFWQENAEEVQRAIRAKEQELAAVKGDIEGVLTLAGALSPSAACPACGGVGEQGVRECDCDGGSNG